MNENYESKMITAIAEDLTSIKIARKFTDVHGLISCHPLILN
jgi:hypothetical protein